jgi:integrase
MQCVTPFIAAVCRNMTPIPLTPMNSLRSAGRAGQSTSCACGCWGDFSIPCGQASGAYKRLDFLYEDLAAALKRLLRLTDGDYSPDKYAERFPKTVAGTDSGITPWPLFTKWIDERQPARSTVESWRYVFQELEAHFKDRSAASIMPEEASEWVKALISPERSAATVKRTWLNAANTVFRWAFDHEYVGRNAFAGIKVTVPKKKRLRETRAFHADEARTILKAAAAMTDTRTPHEACKRWVPWLCAYTGARPGEMAQLRGFQVGGGRSEPDREVGTGCRPPR